MLSWWLEGSKKKEKMERMNDCALKAYNELRNVYIDIQRKNNDKAANFRQIFEAFAKDFMPEIEIYNIGLQGKLTEILNRISRKSYKIKEIAKELIDELNTFHHPKKDEDGHYSIRREDISTEKLQDLYKRLLCVIEFLTVEQPDEKSLVLSGIKTDWMTKGLNEEQKAAIVDDHKLLEVNAGPGTGKTHLLVRKMAYYLEKSPKDRVVALSFTNAAADQLRRKFSELIEDNAKSWMGINCTMGTIHSFCFTQLARYNEYISQKFDYEIVDDANLDEIADAIAEELAVPYQKNRIISILTVGGTNDELSKKVAEYKKAHHFIRVEEILTLFKATFDKNGQAYSWLQGLVNFLLIDEAQDLTKEFFEVVALLYSANPQMKMFFVGDPRQNIFGFNGGSYNHLKDFKLRIQITDTYELPLTQTYRCPKQIVELVNTLKFDDCKNYKLIPCNTIESKVCNIYEFNDSYQEADAIVKIIQSGENYNEDCVMCSGLWYLESVAKILNAVRIPFIVKGGKRILKPIIQIINDCLRLIDTNNENSKSRLNRRIKGFEDSELCKLLEKRYKENYEGLSLSSLVKEIVSHLPDAITKDYYDVISAYEKESETPQYKNISEFLFACASRKNDTFSIFYEQDFKVTCTTPSKGQAVTLSTIHSAKGLEWENVILAGMYDGMLPSYKLNQERDIDKARIMLNDEKKKYYVAVTRSKKNLWMTFVNSSTDKFGRKHEQEKSRFVSI